MPSGFARLVRVQIEPQKAAVNELTLIVPGGRRIVVPGGFDADLLRQLLAVLNQA